MKHTGLAFLVVLLWGLNFIFVKISLVEISPLLLCTLRFIFASVPAIFFIKPPANIPFRFIFLYGIIMFVMQFSFVFLGLHAGMSPGMASIVMQSQVIFSLFFAILFLGERPTSWEITGASVSMLGIFLIALHVRGDSSFLGFLFILAAAASWGAGNLITKKIKNTNDHTMFALIIWGSFLSIFPTLLLCLFIEGPSSIVFAYHHLSLEGGGSVLYTAYASTLLGYGIWNWLLMRYPVGTVVPFTLLIPVVGVVSSILLLGEPLEGWKMMAGLLVLSGLGITIFSNYLTTVSSSLEEVNRV